MRIASLLPSATEIVCALGLRDQLVAITHECDYPAGLEGIPVVTSSVLSAPASSLEIDRHIRELVHEGSSIYRLDAERLQSQKPDLILTQELCDVCAVSYPIVQDAARWLDGPAQIVSLEPQSLEDVFKNIGLIGELTGRAAAASRLVGELSDRVARLRVQLGERSPRTVLCLEWIDPPFNAGHWTPGLVELAGGRDPFGKPGAPAVPLSWDKVSSSEADVVVVMACGLRLDRSLEEAAALSKRLAGRQLWVVDGNAYFSRPGPRLVDSIELMAGILHPDVVGSPSPEVARRLN
jgi:iron complex transport system substrate-binding protein